jgi:hypothetical protein
MRTNGIKMYLTTIKTMETTETLRTIRMVNLINKKTTGTITGTGKMSLGKKGMMTKFTTFTIDIAISTKSTKIYILFKIELQF